MTASSRETAYLAAVSEAKALGRKHPECNLCGGAILPAEKWHESHVGVPKALGGRLTGIAHDTCNHEHGAKVVIPFVAKAKRLYRKHHGIEGPGKGKGAMPCGRSSGFKKTMHNGVVKRVSQAEKHRALMARLRGEGME